MNPKRLLVAALLLMTLAGCTQEPPPAGTTPPGTTPPVDELPPAEAAVAFTSHEDGATIIGSRSLVVVAALTDASDDADIEIDADATVLGSTRTADELRIELELRDHANTVTVTVANPDQDPPATASLELDYPFISLEDGQAAGLVIGQPDFTSQAETDPRKTVEGPYGRPLVHEGVVYLPDQSRGRVMGFLQVPTENGAAADFVIGQQDFDGADGDPSAATMGGPQTVGTDGERLFVLDNDWSRITVHAAPPTTSGVAAGHVIGQADFDTLDYDTTPTRFYSPESIAIAGGKLIVADAPNNRVLIWNEVPTTIDVPADLVLGQPDMTSYRANNDASGEPTARTLYDPSDAWSDGTRLVVADTDNHRVLIWNTFPTTSYAPADLVLGQADMFSRVEGAGREGLYDPYSLHSNGNQLFVADRNNHRVLVWNGLPTESGQLPDVVLGQSDFTGDAANGSRGTAGALDARGFHNPTGVYANGNKLFVADRNNHRYLVFDGARP